MMANRSGAAAVILVDHAKVGPKPNVGLGERASGTKDETMDNSALYTTL